MKQLIGFLFIILASTQMYATQQQPDYLQFQNETLDLATGWGHPSPLQAYYFQKKLKSPFKMLHTANYRGHVASWEIEDNKLFLKAIQVGPKKYLPTDLRIRPKRRSLSNDARVLADWFNGVIEARLVKKSEKRWQYIKTIYFYIRDGKIIKQQEFNESDYATLREKGVEVLFDKLLVKKKEMLELNHNYISYYFRLDGDETVNFEGTPGLFATKTGFSAVLAYYDDDHLKWPYNWTNSAKNGAPKGNWLIENDKLYLTELKLNTGTDFYEVEKENLKLSELFKTGDSEQKVLAGWLSGVFLIKFGEMVNKEGLSDYQEFKVSEYVFLRLDKGIITEKYKVEKDFDFKNITYNTLPEIRKIIEDFGVN